MAHNISKLLESFAWALFLILLGGLWLAPAGTVHEDAWLVGAGLILLGLNFARWLLRLEVSALGCVLGVAAVASGIDAVGELNLPLFAIALLVLGASLLVKSAIRGFSGRARSTAGDSAPAEEAEDELETGGHPYRTASPPADSPDEEPVDSDWRGSWCFQSTRRWHSRKHRRSSRGSAKWRESRSAHGTRLGERSAAPWR